MNKPITILFRRDNDTAEEYDLISKLSLPATVVSSRMDIPSNSLVVGRYSVLPFYQELVEDLTRVGSSLINSYKQHTFVADIRNWYPILKDYTPRTWFTWDKNSLPDNISFIVKGLTNSRKHQWNRQMFAKDKEDLFNKVLPAVMDDTFIRDQGICIREYVPIKSVGQGINGLPITDEWRVFLYKNKFLSYGYYWSEHYEEIFEQQNRKLIHPVFRSDNSSLTINTFIQHIADLVEPHINFWVLDIGWVPTENRWIVVELNDGQMSGLSMNDPAYLYKELCTSILNDD